nr:MAG TPA: hypothetical protein [Caudoviricetes sp.]
MDLVFKVKIQRYSWYLSFSPRNGEIILNNINKRIHCDNLYVSVP